MSWLSVLSYPTVQSFQEILSALPPGYSQNLITCHPLLPSSHHLSLGLLFIIASTLAPVVVSSPQNWQNNPCQIMSFNPPTPHCSPRVQSQPLWPRGPCIVLPSAGFLTWSSTQLPLIHRAPCTRPPDLPVAHNACCCLCTCCFPARTLFQ